jgi:hypothetical protein
VPAVVVSLTALKSGGAQEVKPVPALVALARSACAPAHE